MIQTLRLVEDEKLNARTSENTPEGDDTGYWDDPSATLPTELPTVSSGCISWSSASGL